MIREILKPQKTQLTIDIPESYIGKEIELIVFPISEKIRTERIKKTKKKKSLRGVFSQYANKSKVPLEDSAWHQKVTPSKF